jgi:hypothetical protein
MPTRSASDYVSFVKAQVLSQTAVAVPQARNILRYENSSDQLRAVTQLSDMRYLTTGRQVPSRLDRRQIVQNRSNPKNLAQVGFLGSAGVLGQIVNRPQPRTSGTSQLIVLQTSLIQNAQASAGQGAVPRGAGLVVNGQSANAAGSNPINP